MSIRKLEDGQYLVDIRPAGRNGKRIRRKFGRKMEAVAYERWICAKHEDRPWVSKRQDGRLLSELIRQWWIHRGQHEKWGAKDKMRLEQLDVTLGSVRAFQIDQQLLTRYRAFRLAEGVKASTINRAIATLGGMFSFLIEGGFYHCNNPVSEMRKLRVNPTAMSYLTSEEIEALLPRLSGDNRKIVVFCLSTGARWSEAAKLRAEHIINRLAYFVETKNGRQRSVPISEELAQSIRGVGIGLVFPDADYEGIRRTLKEVKPSLPKGQGLHVLRHTYATHFMINGGNIVTLQRILGHANIQQTMTYAHFAPDYLKEAVRLNPLKGGLGEALPALSTGGEQ